ncbi:hypothetical protein SAMN06297251_12747 [Fulvimarina manganoxydans]|uniref:Phage regulatory protein CII (CP76) n=1 Tax=Fulvimarina manganoxydans TaxID=937218 RepID=A0A1W2EKE7_9HYPH|nr:phage regulatory CII family protein [Fulvimarina manganoxydans]SMD10199.1 hypothetical protein SAMN06297251_12747 [Fulvimarina manganoxydans]
MSELSPDDRALKVMTSALIDACGGACAAAQLLGKAQSLVSGYAVMSEPKRFMPLSDVATLERHCGQPIVSRWLVDRHTAPPKPEALALNDVGRLTIETGDVARVVLQALEDGRVDSAERQAIRRELGELVRAASLILEKVSQP